MHRVPAALVLATVAEAVSGAVPVWETEAAAAWAAATGRADSEIVRVVLTADRAVIGAAAAHE